MSFWCVCFDIFLHCCKTRQSLALHKAHNLIHKDSRHHKRSEDSNRKKPESKHCLTKIRPCPFAQMLLFYRIAHKDRSRDAPKRHNDICTQPIRPVKEALARDLQGVVAFVQRKYEHAPYDENEHT